MRPPNLIGIERDSDLSYDFGHWYERQGPRCVILTRRRCGERLCPPRSSSVNAEENSAIMSIHGLGFKC